MQSTAGLAPNAPQNDADDQPLREDIRLLGRILGDTIREQRGEAIFDTVERIRRYSIRFRRDEDSKARQELAATLNSLARANAIQIIRAFGFFSHLANIAEDQHHLRQIRGGGVGGGPPRAGGRAAQAGRAPPARRLEPPGEGIF
jgi:phosphoenolpyruvate carboxylase